jgi:hypothetical protein
VKRLSFSFVILTGPRADIEGKLFLERSFIDLVRKPLSNDMPERVNYQDMVNFFKSENL